MPSIMTSAHRRYHRARELSVLNLLPWTSEATCLRLFRSTDLAQFQAYRTDPVLARFQGWSAMSDIAAREFIEEMSSVAALRPGDWIQLAIAHAATDRLIGDIGLYLDADELEAELGFTLSREAQGQGHASRAARIATGLMFRCSKVKRVRGVTDARNDASIAVLERANFSKVCERRAEFKGEQCTEFVYECRTPGA
jgi:RimJ/RimL family protein N-acetyltransferase